MKRNLCLLLPALALAALPAFAQSSVWKATKGGATVYLGGTCHLLRATDLPFPREFEQAFAAAEKVYFETDSGRIRSPELQQVMRQRGMFTDGTTLDKVLKPETWAKVRDYAEAAGWPMSQVARTRPWLFSIMFTSTELHKLGVSERGVDAIYFDRVQAAGKKPGELETFEDHVNFVARMGDGHENELIESSFEDVAELPVKVDLLLAAWKSGDMEAIDREMNEDLRTKTPALYQLLIAGRNRSWLPRIEAMFESAEVELVLAGAAHFAGADGLIALLRARGYAIEQVRTAEGPAKN